MLPWGLSTPRATVLASRSSCLLLLSFPVGEFSVLSFTCLFLESICLQHWSTAITRLLPVITFLSFFFFFFVSQVFPQPDIPEQFRNSSCRSVLISFTCKKAVVYKERQEDRRDGETDVWRREEERWETRRYRWEGGTRCDERQRNRWDERVI